MEDYKIIGFHKIRVKEFVTVRTKGAANVMEMADFKRLEKFHPSTNKKKRITC